MHREVKRHTDREILMEANPEATTRARQFLEDYGIDTDTYTRQGSEHPMTADLVQFELAAVARGRSEVSDLEASNRPNDIRAKGWMVAGHHDYRRDGEFWTSWLFVKVGHAIRGEGRTDAEALGRVRAQIAELEIAEDKEHRRRMAEVR